MEFESDELTRLAEDARRIESAAGRLIALLAVAALAGVPGLVVAVQWIQGRL